MANFSLVQRQEVTITNADAGNSKDFLLLTAVKLGSAYVVSSVMENRAGNARGATAKLIDATHVRISWPGALAGGESITVSFEVFDADDVCDELLELHFRADRALAYLGGNIIKDKVVYNDAGVMVSWRLRLFDSKANAEAALSTIDTLGGLVTGEVQRINVTKDVTVGLNKLKSLAGLADVPIATPGVS